MIQKLWKNDRFLGWAIFFIALIPRVLPSSGVYLNVDAAGHWITRTKSFVLGLTGGDVSLLAQSVHPGVPLMWLMGVGEVFLQHTHIERWLADPLVGYLTVLAIPLGIVTAGVAALVWWWGRQILPRGLAATMAILLALDPLYLAFSRQLQLDALLTGFVSLGVLTWWGALQTGQTRWARIAGICFALATLTRWNAGVAFAFAMGTWLIWTNRKNWQIMRALFGWAVIAAMIIWPVMLVHPLGVVHIAVLGLQLGFTPHELIASGLPGWIQGLYFPLFLLTRISSVELALLLIGGVMLFQIRRRRLARSSWYFLAWSFFILAIHMIGRKQIDRYVLPAVFGLIAIMAEAWMGVIVPWMRRQPLRKVIVAGVVAWQLIAIGSLQPYFQTYRNVLGEILVRTPVRASPALWPDWGEGIREAMNELHDRTGRWPMVASWYPAVACVYAQAAAPNTFPFTPTTSLHCSDAQAVFSPRARAAEYILISRDQRIQNFYPSREIERLGWRPEFVVRLNRQPFVWVYRNQGNLPPPANEKNR